MTDVNEHLSTSSSSETSNAKDSGVDAVSRERVDSETELNCSIEIRVGDESVAEDDEETKRDAATEEEKEEEDSETEEENETLDVDKEDDSIATEVSLRAATERSGPEEALLNGEARTEENVSNTGDLSSRVECNEEGADSRSPEQSSVVEDSSSKVGENVKESPDTKGDEERSKADDECSKVKESHLKADEECSKVEETSSKVDALCSKADEEYSDADKEFSKSVEEHSNADKECSEAVEECSKADKECSKVEETSAKVNEVCSKADEEYSDADKEFSKAVEEHSNADRECSEAVEECLNAVKEFSKADEECSKVEEASSKVNEIYSKADEEHSNTDEEFSKVVEECSKPVEECSKAVEECSTAVEECSLAVEGFPIADEVSLKADKECLKADEKFSKAVEDCSKAVEECSLVDEEFPKADVISLKADEEYSDAEEESSKSDDEYSEAEEEFTEADEDISKADAVQCSSAEIDIQNTEIKEKIEIPSSNVQMECVQVEEIHSEVEEITEQYFNAEKHSVEVEEKSSKVEKNAEKEASNERNVETEIITERKESESHSEVSEENSEVGEDKETTEEEEEEDGDTETEEGSSQETGTEQEDSEDDGDDNEEEEEEEEAGSDKDAESASGWDEKRDVGDGEEETEVKVEKKLDDDEDKANPAYIPRKGAFYEHDSRLEDVDDEEEDKGEKEQPVPGKRLWVDDHKWEHDRFDAREQAPKSTQELIGVYGCDIRRGKESDIPVRDSMPRTRRPGDKNRFGDFVRRQVSDEHSGDDGDFRGDSRRMTSNRNRFNNGNRRYQGRRENFRNSDASSVGFSNSDFPALQQNVDIVVKSSAAVAQQMNEKSNEERNGEFSGRRSGRRASRDDDEDMEDVETRSRNQSYRRGGNTERNDGDFRKRRDRRGYADDDNNEEDFDNRRRAWQERRGGAGESRGGASRFGRGRGRGRGGRWQRDRHDPDGRNRNWEERETNENRSDGGYKGRSSRNSESSVVEEIPPRSRERRPRVADSETSQSGDLESHHSRQRDFDTGPPSDYSPRDNRIVRNDGRELGGRESGGRESGGRESGGRESGGREPGGRELVSPHSGRREPGGREPGGRELGGDQALGYDRQRGRGRGNRGRHEETYDSNEQRPRRDQEHSYRGQRPRQDRDNNRFRDKDHQESFPTRTIQNSNIPSIGRPYSDAKTREEEKQELLSCVTAEIRKMNVNEREQLVAQQHQQQQQQQQQAGQSSVVERVGDGNLLPGSYWHGRRFDQRGMDGDARTVNEKANYHRDIASGKPEDGSTDVRRKSSVIIQTTDAPEMLPPVTTIQTISRPAEQRPGPEPRPTSDRPPNRGWAGGEFTPAWRLPSEPAIKAEPTHPPPSGKPKRYSTLRQKAAGAEAAYTEPVNTDYQVAAGGHASQPLTTALPSRPLPAATYYDSSSSYVAAPSFHAAPGLTLGMHHQLAAFQMQAANAQHGLYNSQQQYNMTNPAQVAKPGTPTIQQFYMPHSGSMLPNPYMSMMNYPSHFPMAQVQLPPSAQPQQLHHGTMSETESAIELHRMMYYQQQQQGLPMSMMQQYIDQNAYMNEQSQVDHNVVGHEGYIGASELTSQSQGTHEY